MAPCLCLCASHTGAGPDPHALATVATRDALSRSRAPSLTPLSRWWPWGSHPPCSPRALPSTPWGRDHCPPPPRPCGRALRTGRQTGKDLSLWPPSCLGFRTVDGDAGFWGRLWRTAATQLCHPDEVRGQWGSQDTRRVGSALSTGGALRGWRLGDLQPRSAGGCARTLGAREAMNGPRAAPGSGRGHWGAELRLLCTWAAGSFPASTCGVPGAAPPPPCNSQEQPQALPTVPWDGARCPWWRAVLKDSRRGETWREGGAWLFQARRQSYNPSVNNSGLQCAGGPAGLRWLELRYFPEAPRRPWQAALSRRPHAAPSLPLACGQTPGPVVSRPLLAGGLLRCPSSQGAWSPQLLGWSWGAVVTSAALWRREPRPEGASVEC